MILSLEGPQGTGKSQTGVSLCWEVFNQKQRKVISNNHLNFEHTHFDLEYFLSNLATGELEECVIFLDEAYQYMDSRFSQTKVNKIFSYFIVQTRKRGVDLIYCTHHSMNVDVRLRRATDIRGSCRFAEEKPCRLCKGSGLYKGEKCIRCYGYGKYGESRVTFLNQRGNIDFLGLGIEIPRRRRFTLVIEGPKYWSLYETKERMPIKASVFQGIDTTEIV